MEDIRFVLEAPQNIRTQKKRPRLVTSCDNCRLKKIKCIQSAANTVCEACNAAHLPCRFRDRERYFAERSRLVSSSSKVAAAEKHPTNLDMTTDISPPSANITTPRPNGSVTRTSPKRSAMFHPYSTQSAQPPRSNSLPLDSPPTPPPPPPTLSPLFDPKFPERPHSRLMMSFINAFFDNLSVWFPFIAFDETIKRFLMHDLPVFQANCIAALAVRYVKSAEITDFGVSRATDDYATVAKSLASMAIAEGPDMDTLHALILLSWVEYNQQRQAEFIQYARLAIHMAISLGLSDETAITNINYSEYERTLLKNTQMCINVLESTLQSCGTVPMSI